MKCLEYALAAAALLLAVIAIISCTSKPSVKVDRSISQPGSLLSNSAVVSISMASRTIASHR